MFGIVRDYQALRAFESLTADARGIVFYSEGSADWPHLGPVVEALLRDHDGSVVYLTSEATDPGLGIVHPRLRSFNIGAGTIRTMLFRRIDCGRFVMTLPDLDRFWLKRSVHPVQYVYLFHSINSTHTAYRTGAFDAYDTIFCVGPHHVAEIRRTEAAYGLPAKELIEHGSVKLDTLMAEIGGDVQGTGNAEPQVLIAPTWGESSLIEQSVGRELIDVLLASGFRTVLRLHPMTVRRLPGLVRDLVEAYGDEGLFTLEEDMNAVASWLRSDVMISDWSGAAIEYAFALRRPVVYIDTPQKLSNPEWERTGGQTAEAQIRSEIGHVVGLSDVAGVPQVLAKVLEEAEGTRMRAQVAHDRWVFNVGHAAAIGARWLAGTEPRS